MRKKIEHYPNLEGGELDLREFKNVELINIYGSSYLKTPLTKLNVNGLDNLTSLVCSNNSFASIDFSKQLPRPEKLTYLRINNNNIQSTTLDFLELFVNLEALFLGMKKIKLL